MSPTKSPWPGIIYPVPGRFDQNKSGNLVNFSYSVVKNSALATAPAILLLCGEKSEGIAKNKDVGAVGAKD